MPVTFGREIINREVHDSADDRLGSVTDFTIDMWGIVPNGKPMKFKSRRKVTKQDSEKTWQQLIEANWVEFNCEKSKTA